MVIPGPGSTVVQSLLFHCALSGGRQYKIALKGDKNKIVFANILKHIARKLPPERTRLGGLRNCNGNDQHNGPGGALGATNNGSCAA